MSNPLLNDRYQIIENLGSGGFGETFLAEDTQMPSRRRCVVKKLRPIQNNPALRQLIQERFQLEAAILEDLSIGNGQIPQLYAYFYSEKDQQFYIVQEWINGNTLDMLLPPNSQMEEVSVRQILTDTLPVLSYIHSKLIVHRDIKPDNIILRHSDTLPVLIDFGAVREAMSTVMNSKGQPVSSIVIGTPGYMPVEQSIGRPVYSSDLYSLGLTAIFLLTGKHPSDLPSDLSNCKILWRNQAPQISPSLTQILDKAISYDYRDRYQSADEFLAALQDGKAANKTPSTKKHNPNHFTHPVNPSVLDDPIDIKKMLMISGAISVVIVGTILAAIVPSMTSSNSDSNNIDSSSVSSTTSDTTASSPENKSSSPQSSTTADPSDIKALENYNKLIEGDSQNPAIYNNRGILKQDKMNDPQGALTDYNKAISLYSKNASPYNNRGVLKQYKLNDPQGALSDYNQAILKNPKFEKAYHGRGNLKQYKLNDPQGALADYNKVIALDSKDVNAYYNRGVLKQDKLNDPQGALVDYNKAIALDPKNANVYNFRGNLKQDKLNDLQGALEDYNQSISINSNGTDAYNGRGNLKSKLNDPQGALADYNKAISIDSKYVIAYNNRGNLKYQKLNDSQSALDDFNKALSVDSKDINAYYNRGDFHYSQGNSTEAERDFQQLVSLDSSSAMSLIARGVLALSQRQSTQAIQYFNQAQKIDSNFGDIYKYRGLAYQQQNQTVLATADWRKAVELYSKNNYDSDHQLVKKWMQLP